MSRFVQRARKNWLGTAYWEDTDYLVVFVEMLHDEFNIKHRDLYDFTNNVLNVLLERRQGIQNALVRAVYNGKLRRVSSRLSTAMRAELARELKRMRAEVKVHGNHS